MSDGKYVPRMWNESEDIKGYPKAEGDVRRCVNCKKVIVTHTVNDDKVLTCDSQRDGVFYTVWDDCACPLFE